MYLKILEVDIWRLNKYFLFFTERPILFNSESASNLARVCAHIYVWLKKEALLCVHMYIHTHKEMTRFFTRCKMCWYMYKHIR